MGSPAAQLGLFAAPAPVALAPEQFAALGNPIRGRVRDAFDCMGVAEEEMAAAKADGTLFAALVPTAPLLGKSLDLYRAHARELVQRAAAGAELEPATEAELLSVMLETALTAPLKREGQALAEHLFARVFPAGAAGVVGEVEREKWPGQVAEDLAALRRRYRQDRGMNHG